MRKVLKILSIISYVIIIVYILVLLPKLFGLQMLIVDTDLDQHIYDKNSIVYYYETESKSITIGDIITFKKDDNILSGTVTKVVDNKFKVMIDTSEYFVEPKSVLGKNINIVIRYIGPLIAFMNNNIVLSMVVLFGFIITYIVYRVIDKRKDKKVDSNFDINKKVEKIENKSHKKVLEIDE